MKKILFFGILVIIALFIFGGKKPETPPAPSPNNSVSNEDGADAALPAPVETPAKSPPKAVQPAAPSASSKEIIIGFEYAVSGMAEAFAKIGATGMKFFPDAIAWGKMQKSSSAPIDFSVLDKMVSEYQDAGFKNIVIALKPHSSWASKNILTSPAPKDEFLDKYEAWVQGIVERYDADANSDMPGLKYPIRYYEVGVEFSSYEPEPVSEYLNLLERAYKASHAAYAGVKIGHAAFLLTAVFKDNPSSNGYAAAFQNALKPMKDHSYADIQAILDRPDIFDFANFHALGDPYEIKDTVAWLKYEMNKRGYARPIVISDTAITPFIAWGQATDCKAAAKGLIIPPATESDRCRIAEYFKKLIAKDQATLDWAREYVGSDMVKKVVIAAEQGVELIDTSFMEDLEPFKALLKASAGNSAWGGMVQTKTNLLTQTRTVTGYYPSFYAVQELVKNIKGYTAVSRTQTGDKDIYAYEFTVGAKPVWVAWYEPPKLVLPGDPMPQKQFSIAGKTVTLTPTPLFAAGN